MKIREERVLAGRKLAKSGGQVDELLAACWEETLDPSTPGPTRSPRTVRSTSARCSRATASSRMVRRATSIILPISLPIPKASSRRTCCFDTPDPRRSGRRNRRS